MILMRARQNLGGADRLAGNSVVSNNSRCQPSFYNNALPLDPLSNIATPCVPYSEQPSALLHYSRSCLKVEQAEDAVQREGSDLTTGKALPPLSIIP